MKRRDVKKIVRLARQIAEIIGPSSGAFLHGIGKQAEQEFAALATARGFTCENHANRSLAYDLVVNGLLVQVKHRRRLANGSLTLCQNRRHGASRMAYLVGEFDVLALRCDGNWYLMPERVLQSPGGETLVNTLRPENCVEYIDNWGVFKDGGVARRPNQLCLEFSP